MRKGYQMPGIEKCQICEGGGKIQCPCCSGRGGVINRYYAYGVGKSYWCNYCLGVGAILCPRCNKTRRIIQVPSAYTETIKDLLSRMRSTLFHEKGNN
jgi:DnaJ-class molecular chaperone